MTEVKKRKFEEDIEEVLLPLDDPVEILKFYDSKRKHILYKTNTKSTKAFYVSHSIEFKTNTQFDAFSIDNPHPTIRCNDSHFINSLPHSSLSQSIGFFR